MTIIQQHHKNIKSLRDATIQMLDKYLLPANLTVYQRCKYVIEENNRLLEACQDLERGDIKSFGKKMFETHYGLSKLYEVSCPELDFLVSQLENNPDVLGARMMGGGFGGCTINIVKEEAIKSLIAETGKKYYEAMNKTMKVYTANIEDGTSIMKKTQLLS